MFGLPGTFLVVACTQCGLGATLPRLDDEALARYYPDEYPAHGGSAGQWRHAWRHVKFRLGPLRHLLEVPPGRALDVGCGNGAFGEWLIGHGWSVVGVDPSPTACAVASARGLEMHCGTLDSVDLGDERFDAVILSHVLEHLDDPVRGLAAAGKLARPGAAVFVAVPNFGGWQRRRFGDRWFHLDLPRHRHHFTRRSLASALELAELEPARIDTSSSSSGLWGSVQYALAGGCVLRGKLRAAGLLAADLAYPLVAAADLVADGDCLNVVARRRGDRG
jgi:SAM-dependent methyltransferase